MSEVIDLRTVQVRQEVAAPAVDDGAPLADRFPLERASAWIARWALLGGGFSVRVEPSGVVVQLVLAVDRSGGPSQAALDLEGELLAQPRIKMAVAILARAAWERKAAALMEPQGSA